MPIINGIPLEDRPAGTTGNTVLTLPKQPVIVPVPQPTTISYDGKTFRQIPARAVPTVPDGTNDPSYITIGGIQLSGNVIIPVKNEKVIAQSQIIDGVEVFEHISRKSAEIDFDFTIFPNGVIQGTADKTNAFYGVNTFNQQVLNQFWNTLYLPNSVQAVQNTYLNGLGINQIIIKSISVVPRPGSPNITVKLKALENQPGSLFVGFSNTNFIDSQSASSSNSGGFA